MACDRCRKYAVRKELPSHYHYRIEAVRLLKLEQFGVLRVVSGTVPLGTVAQARVALPDRAFHEAECSYCKQRFCLWLNVCRGFDGSWGPAQ
jgi:hypothetical protein